MSYYSFIIPGRAAGKGRPRFAARGKFVQVYTPAETVKHEKAIAELGRAAMAGAPPLEGPIFLEIRATLTPPPSWPKKKREQAFFVTGKPDVDNIEKLIGDALNGICWNDDSQIAAAFISRTYSLTATECVRVGFGILTEQHAELGRDRWTPSQMSLAVSV